MPSTPSVFCSWDNLLILYRSGAQQIINARRQAEVARRDDVCDVRRVALDDGAHNVLYVNALRQIKRELGRVGRRRVHCEDRLVSTDDVGAAAHKCERLREAGQARCAASASRRVSQRARHRHEHERNLGARIAPLAVRAGQLVERVGAALVPVCRLVLGHVAISIAERPPAQSQIGPAPRVRGDRAHQLGIVLDRAHQPARRQVGEDARLDAAPSSRVDVQQVVARAKKRRGEQQAHEIVEFAVARPAVAKT